MLDLILKNVLVGKKKKFLLLEDIFLSHKERDKINFIDRVDHRIVYRLAVYFTKPKKYCYWPHKNDLFFNKLYIKYTEIWSDSFKGWFDIWVSHLLWYITYPAYILGIFLKIFGTEFNTGIFKGGKFIFKFVKNFYKLFRFLYRVVTHPILFLKTLYFVTFVELRGSNKALRRSFFEKFSLSNIAGFLYVRVYGYFWVRKEMMKQDIAKYKFGYLYRIYLRRKYAINYKILPPILHTCNVFVTYITRRLKSFFLILKSIILFLALPFIKLFRLYFKLFDYIISLFRNIVLRSVFSDANRAIWRFYWERYLPRRISMVNHFFFVTQNLYLRVTDYFKNWYNLLVLLRIRFKFYFWNVYGERLVFTFNKFWVYFCYFYTFFFKKIYDLFLRKLYTFVFILSYGTNFKNLFKIVNKIYGTLIGRPGIFYIISFVKLTVQSAHQYKLLIDKRHKVFYQKYLKSLARKPTDARSWLYLWYFEGGTYLSMRFRYMVRLYKPLWSYRRWDFWWRYFDVAFTGIFKKIYFNIYSYILHRKGLFLFFNRSLKYFRSSFLFKKGFYKVWRNNRFGQRTHPYKFLYMENFGGVSWRMFFTPLMYKEDSMPLFNAESAYFFSVYEYGWYKRYRLWRSKKKSSFTPLERSSYIRILKRSFFKNRFFSLFFKFIKVGSLYLTLFLKLVYSFVNLTINFIFTIIYCNWLNVVSMVVYKIPKFITRTYRGFVYILLQPFVKIFRSLFSLVVQCSLLFLIGFCFWVLFYGWGSFTTGIVLENFSFTEIQIPVTFFWFWWVLFEQTITEFQIFFGLYLWYVWVGVVIWFFVKILGNPELIRSVRPWFWPVSPKRYKNLSGTLSAPLKVRHVTSQVIADRSTFGGEVDNVENIYIGHNIPYRNNIIGKNNIVLIDLKNPYGHYIQDVERLWFDELEENKEFQLPNIIGRIKDVYQKGRIVGDSAVNYSTWYSFYLQKYLTGRRNLIMLHMDYMYTLQRPRTVKQNMFDFDVDQFEIKLESAGTKLCFWSWQEKLLLQHNDPSELYDVWLPYSFAEIFTNIVSEEEDDVFIPKWESFLKIPNIIQDRTWSFFLYERNPDLDVRGEDVDKIVTRGLHDDRKHYFGMKYGTINPKDNLKDKQGGDYLSSSDGWVPFFFEFERPFLKNQLSYAGKLRWWRYRILYGFKNIGSLNGLKTYIFNIFSEVQNVRKGIGFWSKQTGLNSDGCFNIKFNKISKLENIVYYNNNTLLKSLDFYYPFTSHIRGGFDSNRLEGWNFTKSLYGWEENINSSTRSKWFFDSEKNSPLPSVWFLVGALTQSVFVIWLLEDDIKVSVWFDSLSQEYFWNNDGLLKTSWFDPCVSTAQGIPVDFYGSSYSFDTNYMFCFYNDDWELNPLTKKFADWDKESRYGSIYPLTINLHRYKFMRPGGYMQDRSYLFTQTNAMELWERDDNFDIEFEWWGNDEDWDNLVALLQYQVQHTLLYQHVMDDEDEPYIKKLANWRRPLFTYVTSLNFCKVESFNEPLYFSDSLGYLGSDFINMCNFTKLGRSGPIDYMVVFEWWGSVIVTLLSLIKEFLFLMFTLFLYLVLIGCFLLKKFIFIINYFILL